LAKPLTEGGVGVGDQTPPATDTERTLPRPKATPSATLSPRELLSTVLRSLADSNTPDEASGLATLHAFCAQGATIGGEPVPENLEDFLDDIDKPTAEKLSLRMHIIDAPKSTPTGYEAGVQLMAQKTFSYGIFHLTRASPEAPLLISAIEFQDSG
jgi:hypothetical protein